MNTRIAVGSLLLISLMVLSGCSMFRGVNNPNGTSWGEGVFTSNGERIYFTATSDYGTDITYTDGPSSSGWMMMGGQLTCASCHGPDGRGGVHGMGMMQVMEAPDIR